MGEKSKMNIKPIYMYISLCSRALVISVLPCLHVKCTFNLKSHYNICLDMQDFKNLFAIFILPKFPRLRWRAVLGFQAYWFSVVLY